MTYFNYHAKVKRKINNNELIDYEIVDNYNNITPALVLYFNDGTKMPIRKHRWEEYFILIEKSYDE